MLTVLVLLCALVWSVLLFHQIVQRGLIILLGWLLIAPVASNVLLDPHANPFFQSPEAYRIKSEALKARKSQRRQTGEFEQESTVNVRELLEPTRLLLFLFFLTFLIDALAGRRPLGPFDRTELFMCGFFLSVLVSVLTLSHHPNYSLRIACDAFLVPFLTYFTARRLVTCELHLRQLGKVASGIALYVIAIAIVERAAHSNLFYRLGGPFYDEGVLYIVLTVGFLIALLDTCYRMYLPNEPQIMPGGVRRFVLGLAPCIIFLTWERGNWVGFLMSIWCFMLLAYRLMPLSRKVLTVGLVCLLIPIIVVGVQALTPDELVEGRIGDVDTVQGRLATWKITIAEGLKHPLLGIGFNNMKDVLIFFRNMNHYAGVPHYVSVHNSYLAFFAEQGGIGLGMYLAIIFSILYKGFQLYRKGPQGRDRWYGVAIIAVMAAHLVPSLFSSKLHLPNPWNGVLVYSFVGSVAGLYSHRRMVRREPVLRVSEPANP